MACHRNLHNTSAVAGLTQFKPLGQNPLAGQDASLICAIRNKDDAVVFYELWPGSSFVAPQPRRLWRTGPGSVASC
jgi:hypothetical protein